MAQAAEAMGKAETDQAEAKVELLNEVTRLRDERILLLDNLRSVVDELESKTDKADSGSAGVIANYRLYIRSLSGIEVDVSDATSAWVAISGWATSSEGGIRWVKNLLTFFGILLLTWFASRLSRRLVRRLTNTVGWPTLIKGFLVRIASSLIWMAGTLWALASLQVSMAPLLALIGAAGFIVAFAMQDITGQLCQWNDDPLLPTI